MSRNRRSRIRRTSCPSRDCVVPGLARLKRNRRHAQNPPHVRRTDTDVPRGEDAQGEGPRRILLCWMAGENSRQWLSGVAARRRRMAVLPTDEPQVWFVAEHLVDIPFTVGAGDERMNGR